MIEFRILKKSKKSRARLGILKTSHGEVETPAFVPVATQAAIKALMPEEAQKTKSQIFIANTFHLHLKPGEKIVKNSGGLHKFMNWQKPLMTDSGGFQVFSLGFGQDYGVGKILNKHANKDYKSIAVNTQPKFLKITDDGVFFRSPVDGQKLFLGPKESIKIQESLGADIIFTFDECTPPLATYEYIKKSLRRTHCWAEECVMAKKSKQSLYGIVQGSKFKDLRQESAKFINSMGFDGFGIGGDLSEDKKTTKKILDWALPLLDENKPRHLLGVGHPEDMELIIKSGVDTFDCTAPTHYARHGGAFTSEGRLDMSKSIWFKPQHAPKPLDKKCDCFVCQTYSRSYLTHLIKAKEIAGLSLLTFHNLWYFNTLVEKIRRKIKSGAI